MKLMYKTKHVWRRPVGVSHIWIGDDTACGKWKKIRDQDKYRTSSKPASPICVSCRGACARCGIRVPE